jgi:hypothetical protein
MRAATLGARIIRNLSWLIIIAIFIAGGERRRTAAFSATGLC